MVRLTCRSTILFVYGSTCPKYLNHFSSSLRNSLGRAVGAPSLLEVGQLFVPLFCVIKAFHTSNSYEQLQQLNALRFSDTTLTSVRIHLAARRACQAVPIAVALLFYIGHRLWDTAVLRVWVGLSMTIVGGTLK